MVIKTVNLNENEHERKSYYECTSCAWEWESGIFVIYKYGTDTIPMTPLRLSGNWEIFIMEKGKTADRMRLRYDEKEKKTRIY